MEPLLEMLSLQGRANRARYFWHVVLDDLVLLTLIVLMIPLTALFSGSTILTVMMMTVLAGAIAGVSWAAIAVTIKRLHDLDRPGWHWWLFLVPFYNLYLGLIVLFKRGTIGPNEYGRDPLQIAAASQHFED